MLCASKQQSSFLLPGKTLREITEDEYTKAELAMQASSPCFCFTFWLCTGFYLFSLTQLLAALSPATVALSWQVGFIVLCWNALPSHCCRSAQHATDHRVLEKLSLTHVINASNKIGNPHVSAGNYCCAGQMIQLEVDTFIPGVEYLTIPVEDSAEASDEFSQVQFMRFGAMFCFGSLIYPQHFPVIRDFLLRVKSSGGKVLVRYAFSDSQHSITSHCRSIAWQG